MKPSGIYVIEDLETKYWRDGDIIYDYKLKSMKIIVAKNAQAVSTAQANPVGASVASNWGQKLDSYALQWQYLLHGMGYELGCFAEMWT